jgi:ABC-type transporter Mla subunit MlaD
MNDVNPDKLLADIRQFLQDANTMIEQGDAVNLGGLDARVGVMCEQILAMAQADSSKYRDELNQLMVELNTLTTALKQQRDQLRDQITGLNTNKKAAAAYQTVQATGKPKE